MSEKKKFQKGLLIAFLIIIIIWLIKVSEIVFEISFVYYGVLPRNISGLPGILLFPFIHSGFEHLVSNSFPILLLIPAIFYFYPISAARVITLIYFFSGSLLWIVGRESYHIGASAVVYGLVSFLFFSGIIRWDRRSIVLSLLVTFLYGGFTWGVLPIDESVSWEGHLSGAIIGLLCAYIFRKYDPYEKFSSMEDDDEELENFES